MADKNKYLGYEGTVELVNKLKNYADDKIGDVDLTAYEKVEDANEAHKELYDRLDELAEKMNELTGDTVKWVTSEEGFLIALVDNEDSLLLGITKEDRVYFPVGILDGIVDSEKSLRDVLGDYVTTTYLGEYYYTAAQVDQKLLDATQGEPIDLSGYLTKQEAAETYQPLGDYATKSDLPTKTSELTNDSGFLTEGDLGDYAKTSDLPTNVSQLTNDSGYITTSALTGYAKTGDIPTKVSELENDSGFITDSALSDYAKTSDVPTNVSQLTNDSGYITSSALDGLAKTSDIPTKTSELTNDSGYITESALSDYAKTSDVPTKVSELTNDSGYITSSALDGYAKESDVPTKVSELTNDSGYITESALSNYASKESLEDVTSTLNDLTEKVTSLEGDTVKWVTNDDYLIALVDSEDSLLMGIGKDGSLYLPAADVKKMEYVSELPSSPDDGTLYLIPE